MTSSSQLAVEAVVVVLAAAAYIFMGGQPCRRIQKLSVK